MSSAAPLAGIEKGADGLTFADEAIVVTNPVVSSVRDSTASWASCRAAAAPSRAANR